MEEKERSTVSTIFNLLRFHFYPSGIATVATKCGECDKREVESRYGNERA